MTQCVWTANPTTSPVTAGWLKALCPPWTASETYTHSAMPVADNAVPGGWRQQSTLGCYIVEPRTDSVFALSYRSKQTQYCATVEDARAWIESAVSATSVGLSTRRPSTNMLLYATVRDSLHIRRSCGFSVLQFQ